MFYLCWQLQSNVVVFFNLEEIEGSKQTLPSLKPLESSCGPVFRVLECHLFLVQLL